MKVRRSNTMFFRKKEVVVKLMFPMSCGEGSSELKQNWSALARRSDVTLIGSQCCL